MTPAALPGHDLAGYLARYAREAAFANEPPADVFDRYHTADFVLTNDGVRLDRDRLVAHIGPVRKRVVSVRVDVHESLSSDDTVAARYTLTAGMRDGQTLVTAVYAFGRLAPDGRLRRLDQLTRAQP
jgi:hypothetical protein